MKNIYNKNGLLSKEAANIIGMLHSEAKNKKLVRLHLKEWSGRNRNLTLKTALYYNTKHILDHFGIKYTLGNDAVRNGVIGDYIEFKVDKRNRFWNNPLPFQADCPNCSKSLFKSDLKGYTYLCKHCDENFYSFEV